MNGVLRISDSPQGSLTLGVPHAVHFEQVGLEKIEDLFKLHVYQRVLGLFEQREGEAKYRLHAFGEDDIQDAVNQSQRKSAYPSGSRRAAGPRNLAHLYENKVMNHWLANMLLFIPLRRKLV
jgi:hypothetical protein